MVLEFAPALFIQPAGNGIITPGKPTQQNATATKSINVLPVDVSAGVHSGHHPPPSQPRPSVSRNNRGPPHRTHAAEKIRRQKSQDAGRACDVSALPAQAADAIRARDPGRAGSLPRPQ